MEDLLKVGVITTTHGVRGEVKVFPTTDPERFLDLEYVILDAGREMKKLEIRNVKFFKNLAILKFEGVDNINDIEMYKGRDLWIPEWDNPPDFGQVLLAEYIGEREQTQGSETSQYLEEKKSTEILLVAASERGPAQTVCRETGGVVGPAM